MVVVRMTVIVLGVGGWEEGEEKDEGQRKKWV